MAPNEQKRFTFKPDEAFGERIPDLVRVMPLAEFKRHDVDPYPGLKVNLDNATAIVKSINSGRVIVDANHPYAGQEITYEIRIIRQLTSESDKVKALGRTYSAEPSDVEVREKTLEIRFNNDVKKNSDYFIGKANLIASVFSYLKEFEKVNVEEEYIKPKEQPESKEEQMPE